MQGYVDPASQQWQPEALPAAAPAVPAAIPAGGSPTNPVRLPKTGAGLGDLTGLIGALGASAIGSAALGFRRTRR